MRKHRRRLYAGLKRRLGRHTYTYFFTDNNSWFEQMGKRVEITPEDAKHLLSGEIGSFTGVSFIMSDSK
jgi:hypothetical protein